MKFAIRWTNELICVGPALAQLRSVVGVEQTLDSNPIVDMAEHVGFPATCNFGVGGDESPSGDVLAGTTLNDDVVPVPLASTTMIALPTEGYSSKVEMKVGGGTVFVTSTTTDSSPTGYRLGALLCDVVAVKPAYEGFEVAGGRGVCYSESLGGSPVVGGSVEVVDGGELDGDSRSVGKGSVGVDETVSSATTTSGKRLGKTLSSSKISLKNMGKKAVPSLSTGKRLEIVVSSISDNAVRNCNNRYWLENKESKAQKIWNIGKDLGFSFVGKEEVVIKNLQALEARDRDNIFLKRKEFVVSDDENN